MFCYYTLLFEFANHFLRLHRAQGCRVLRASWRKRISGGVSPSECHRPVNLWLGMAQRADHLAPRSSGPEGPGHSVQNIPLKGGGFNSASRLRSLSVLVGTDRVYELKNRILFEY